MRYVLFEHDENPVRQSEYLAITKIKLNDFRSRSQRRQLPLTLDRPRGAYLAFDALLTLLVVDLTDHGMGHIQATETVEAMRPLLVKSFDRISATSQDLLRGIPGTKEILGGLAYVALIMDEDNRQAFCGTIDEIMNAVSAFERPIVRMFLLSVSRAAAVMRHREGTLGLDLSSFWASKDGMDGSEIV